MGRLAADEDLAGGQFDCAGDCLAERRLAGAVLADQCMYLSGTKLEIDAIDGVDTAIDLAAVDHSQHRTLSGGRLLDGVSRQLFAIVHGFAPDGLVKPRPALWATLK